MHFNQIITMHYRKKSIIKYFVFMLFTFAVIATPASADELWDKVSGPNKALYYKDSLFKDDKYKGAYRLGVMLLDGFDCSDDRLRGVGMVGDEAWPNEYLWRYLRGGTTREKYWAARIALDSTNIGKGVKFASNRKDFISDRRRMVDYIINEIIIKGGSKYDNICGREYDNGRNDLISILISAYLYSDHSGDLGGAASIDRYLAAMKNVYEESARSSWKKNSLEDNLRKWPRIFDK